MRRREKREEVYAGEEQAEHFHTICTCPPIPTYRQEVTAATKNVFGDEIDCTFSTI